MYYFEILTWMKGKYKGATEMPLNLGMWFDVRIFSLLCLDWAWGHVFKMALSAIYIKTNTLQFKAFNHAFVNIRFKQERDRTT